MLYVLQQVRFAVRTMKIYVTLLLANECLITHWFEKFPSADEVLYNINI